MTSARGWIRRPLAIGMVVALVAQLAMLLIRVEPAGAAPRVVANPGSFSLGADVGAFKIRDQVFGFEGSDADDITIAGTVDSFGAVALTTVSFPPQTVSASGINATVKINPVFPMTGTLNPATGALSLTVRAWIKIDGIPLGGDCRIGSSGSPITIPLSTSGAAPALVGAGYPAPAPYNQITGDAVVANNTFAVPAASSCGVATGTINDELNLPSPGGFNEVLIDGFTSPTFAGTTFSLTASPSNPVVNRPVTLNASGTTTTNLVRFEFDPEGDGTYVNNGTNPVYVHPGYPTTGAKSARMRAVYTDGNNEVRTTTVTVVPNSPPIAADTTVSTPEDTSTPVVLSASDPNGDPLDFSITSTPTHGTLGGTSPNLSYTPQANFHGTDTIGFSVSDGNGGTDTGTVTITVSPVNDPPVAVNSTLSVTEDIAQPVTLVGTDIDGDALSYSITSAAANGSVTCAPPGAPSCLYTPNPDATGADSFTFAVDDGNGGTATGTVSVTIGAVNDPPTATDVALSTPEDTPLPITLGGTDPDGDNVTASISGLPSHGTLSGTAPAVTYTPAANYYGPDAFTFQASDGNGGTDAGIVEIMVTPVNDDPTAGAVTVPTTEDTPVDFSLDGNDVDGDTLTFAIDVQPDHGSATCGPSGLCTYVPDPLYAGPDGFTYTVDDGNGGSATGTVSITVAALDNEAPLFTSPSSLVVLEDIARTFTVTATDADGDPVTLSAGDPMVGSLTGTAPTFTYTPAPNFAGTDTVQVTADDGRGGVTTRTLTFTVIALNDAPVAVAQATSTPENTPIDVDLVATDADGDPLTWSIKIAPAHGTAVISGSTLSYTPHAGFVGVDTLDVEASDPSGARSRVVITIDVIDVPMPPVAGMLAVSVLEDGSVVFELPASDPDGGPLAIDIGEPGLGSIQCIALACTYTPDPDANGTDTVPFTATDDDGDTADGSVVITIIATPDHPVATDATAPVAEATPTPVTLGATDPDGDALTFRVVSAPAHGTVTGSAPNLTYRPTSGFTGTDSFAFEVEDPTGRTDTGTITLEVMATDHAPSASNQHLVAAEDTPLAITLAGSDDEGAVTFEIVAAPGHGSLTGTAPFVTYVPDTDYAGIDAFAYRVTDSIGQTADAVITVEVAAVNDRPVAQSASVATARTIPVEIPLPATDADGDPLTYSVVSGPFHGQLDIDGETATYTPDGIYAGADAFTFRATDPGGAFGSATVSIAVQTGADLDTALSVEPGSVKRELLRNRFNNLAATLTVPAAGGVPLAGVEITFTVDTRVICRALTDAAGRATCSGYGPLLHGLLATKYTATYPGGPGFTGTSAQGPLQ